MTAGTFHIGGERAVGRLGFGAMHLRPESPAERESCVAVARRAVELGVTLIDTAHLYGWGANEELLAEALYPYPQELLVATKVGVAPPADGREADLCGRPEFLREQVEEGLRRLRVDRLELLQLHRVDPKVPLADQVGTLAELRAEGKIVHIGLSEVTVAQLEEARGIVEVASVQNRYNVLDREYEDVLEACEAAGIAFLPWRPVNPAASLGAREVAAVAAEAGAAPAQVALAWLLARSPVVLPIPGTTRIAHLEQNVAAADLRLSDEQYARLDRLAAARPAST
ncbi:aldo/keto reductase [Actinocorallia aurantiaca]|uniref:Aldo/keto reductase n=1 Tax=Actinocorallia aurantiaca TaxID=46204 RepID=A0ABN3UM17_9ACTN